MPRVRRRRMDQQPCLGRAGQQDINENRAGGEAGDQSDAGSRSSSSVHEVYIETREGLHGFLFEKESTKSGNAFAVLIGAVVLRPGQWVRLNRHYYTCYNSIPSLC